MSSPNPEVSQTEQPQKNLKTQIKDLLNFSYLKSINFVLRVILIIFQIAGAISVSVKYDTWGSTRYYNFVAITGVIFIVVFIIFHFFFLTQKLTKIPWSLIELAFDVIWSILILIASAIVTDNAKRYAFMESYASAAFFGYGAFIVFLIDGFLHLISFIRGRKEQTIQSTN
ncbi:unnamed protein product [Brachionus calyciflorus]|uniref:MARVEL domain-containing protein n=1 Tax=Brachionus calyciflorus TaxID=104777 RepID=A0A813VFF0_9BILA|nr:unnamed protein product [Brachionus calyciflorus]